MWCWASVDKANKDLDEAMVVYRLLRMTFGDQSASAFLELALREIVAPLCKTALGKEMLQSNRYVDDGARAHHDKAELHEDMDDVIVTAQLNSTRVGSDKGMGWTTTTTPPPTRQTFRALPGSPGRCFSVCNLILTQLEELFM